MFCHREFIKAGELCVFSNSESVVLAINYASGLEHGKDEAEAVFAGLGLGWQGKASAMIRNCRLTRRSI